jgi:hypothetical protein
VCVCLLLQDRVQRCLQPWTLRDVLIEVCVYYCSTYYKAVREGGGGGSGGHVLRETTSRGLCELVFPSRTSERGREGYCVKEGGGEEGERERERAAEVRLHYNLGY